MCEYLCSWSFHAVHDGPLWRHTLAMERKWDISLVGPQRGGERKIMGSHQSWLIAPAASPLSCILTTAPGEVALPQKTQRESLKKEWGEDHGSAPLSLHQCSTWLSEPNSPAKLEFRPCPVRCFGGGQGSGFLPAFPWLLKEMVQTETSAISLLWYLEACLIHFSERDGVRREHWSLWNKKQQRPLEARDWTQLRTQKSIDGHLHFARARSEPAECLGHLLGII